MVPKRKDRSGRTARFALLQRNDWNSLRGLLCGWDGKLLLFGDVCSIFATLVQKSFLR